jgi:urease accessory protein
MAEGAASGARHLDLSFARAPDGVTFLARQRAAYPFHITRPFAEEGGIAALTLQSVGGGIVEGDRLDIAVTVGPRARARLASQAATVVHGMPERGASIDQHFAIESGGWFIALPDPLILFPGAAITVATRASVAPDATLVLCESWLAHDPEVERRPFARLSSGIAVERPDGSLLVLDSSEVDGASFAAALGSMAAVALFVVITARTEPAPLADALHEALKDRPGIRAGASTLPHGCGACARLLAADGAALKGAVMVAWATVRERLGLR